MKAKFFSLMILMAAFLQGVSASNQLPVDPFADSPSVIAFANDPMQADAFAVRKDTTITIYGSGGMNNDNGTICPTTAASKCATIILHGMAVPGTGGTLEWPENRAEVTVQTISNTMPDANGSLSMQGRFLTFTVNK